MTTKTCLKQLKQSMNKESWIKLLKHLDKKRADEHDIVLIDLLEIFRPFELLGYYGSESDSWNNWRNVFLFAHDYAHNFLPLFKKEFPYDENLDAALEEIKKWADETIPGDSFPFEIISKVNGSFRRADAVYKFIEKKHDEEDNFFEKFSAEHHAQCVVSGIRNLAHAVWRASLSEKDKNINAVFQEGLFDLYCASEKTDEEEDIAVVKLFVRHFG
jgi:hypothetical protein